MVVWNLGEKKKQISHRAFGNNGIVFKTLDNQNYLVVPKGKEDIVKQRIYKGIQNNAPKIFYEATLGKSRNF